MHFSLPSYAALYTCRLVVIVCSDLMDNLDATMLARRETHVNISPATISRLKSINACDERLRIKNQGNYVAGREKWMVDL
jgi:hypothetical protein